MKKIEYEKFKQHILSHEDDNPKRLKEDLDRYLLLPESNGTLWGAVNTMCQYGCFDVYYRQVMDTLKEIYSDEFNESKYMTKDGQFRLKNNEAYCWVVYKAKVAKAIEMMIKNGEI